MLRDSPREAMKVAALIQAEARKLGLVVREQTATMRIFDALVTDAALRDTSRQLFLEGHHALAVEEAFKCVNNVVKARTGLGADGADLMRTALSPKKPVLKLSDLRTESQQNQQLGYMQMLAGCMTGIRNPRAHEHRYLDEPHVALELLVMANHLLRVVRGAKRSRKHRQGGIASAS
jgi:uncharacterized protein (TIGR02391 family)